MRLPADDRQARFVRLAAALIPALALGACGGSGGSEILAASAAPPQGPQGDYPVVVGEPYTVAGTSYTPEDVLNYDQVGFVAADASGGGGVSGSHHTLPVPSYVEVTSLETGRTILVRIERRGPMNSNELLALSPGALEQLGTGAGAAGRAGAISRWSGFAHRYSPRPAPWRARLRPLHGLRTGRCGRGSTARPG